MRATPAGGASPGEARARRGGLAADGRAERPPAGAAAGLERHLRGDAARAPARPRVDVDREARAAAARADGGDAAAVDVEVDARDPASGDGHASRAAARAGDPRGAGPR